MPLTVTPSAEDHERLARWREAQKAAPPAEELYVGLGVTSFGSGETGHTHEVNPEQGLVRCAECSKAAARAGGPVEVSLTIKLSHGVVEKLSASALELDATPEEYAAGVLSAIHAPARA